MFRSMDFILVFVSYKVQDWLTIFKGSSFLNSFVFVESLNFELHNIRGEARMAYTNFDLLACSPLGGWLQLGQPYLIRVELSALTSCFGIGSYSTYLKALKYGKDESEGQVVAALSTFIRTSWKIAIYNRNGALLIFYQVAL